METIDERRELTSNEEAASSGNHPLLIESVLTRLFGFLSVGDLKTARLVCEHWKYSATPSLREKTVVKLSGVCPLCKSEWKLSSKSVESHDHRHTITFYRFVLETQTKMLKEREELFFKNFQISQLNLYFMPRIRPEPTKYFLSFIKLLGDKVCNLTLDGVQLCPTESVYRLLSLFRNLERVVYNNVSVWTDPVSQKNGVKNNNNGSNTKTPQNPDPGTGAVAKGVANGFLTALTISGEWTCEEFLSWDRVFKASPELRELKFVEVPKKEILNSISALVALPKEDLEGVKLKKLTILPRGRMEDQINQEAFQNDNDPDPDLDSDFNGRGSDSECESELESLPEKVEGQRLSLVKKRELELNSLDLTRLLTLAVENLPISELTLRLPYIGDEGFKFPEILRAGADKFVHLTLCRHPTLFFSPTKSFQFRASPFGLLSAERERERNRESIKPIEECVVFPFVKRLSLAHNFIDNFDEVKTSFPSLEQLTLNIVPTEVSPCPSPSQGQSGRESKAMSTSKLKSYHTYLRTSLLLSMKNASVNGKVKELVWNLEEPRNPKTGIRTVVYKTNALRHLSKIFTGLTKLSVSVTRASDLHVIFRDLAGTLQELTVLKNSFYRTKDEDIIGWADSDSDSDCHSDSESGSNDEEEEESSGIERGGGSNHGYKKSRKKSDKLQNLGIKQMKHLRRLSLENNNCCLTNRSIRHGFVLLKNLRSLHIIRGKKITISALHILTRCPYLVNVHITQINCGQFPFDDEELLAAYQLAIITEPLFHYPPPPPYVPPPVTVTVNGQTVQEPAATPTNVNIPTVTETPPTPSPTPTPTPCFTPEPRPVKSKIPALVLPPNRKMGHYTPPPKSFYTSTENGYRRVNRSTRGGTLPSITTTTTKTTMDIHYTKESCVTTLPPITSSATPSVAATTSPLKLKISPEDILPEIGASDLKYILSLSESELEKYEERQRQKNIVYRKKPILAGLSSTDPQKTPDKNSDATKQKVRGQNWDLQLGIKPPGKKSYVIPGGSGSGGSRRMARLKKGGKFEMGEKYHKIGGRRYFFVKTKYKVNGRSYSLVRRKYENEGEKEKIYAKQRAWLARKRLQQSREAAKLKNGKANSGLLEELDEQALTALRKSIEENEEESEYERSIKEYDEEDEEDELEEYCDEDNIDNDDLVTPVSTGSEWDTDSETSAEEGIFLDDPFYEGDKEFYDYDSGQGAEQARQNGESSSESESESESESKNKRESKSKNQGKSAAKVSTPKSKQKSKSPGKKGRVGSAPLSADPDKNQNQPSSKKRVSFQKDEKIPIKTRIEPVSSVKQNVRSHYQYNSNSQQTKEKEKVISRVEKRRRSRYSYTGKFPNRSPPSPPSPPPEEILVRNRRSRSRQSQSQSHGCYPDDCCMNYPQSHPDLEQNLNYPRHHPDFHSPHSKVQVKQEFGNLEDEHQNRNTYRRSIIKNVEHSYAGEDSAGSLITTVQVEKINVDIVEVRNKKKMPEPSLSFELELEKAVEEMSEELHSQPQIVPDKGQYESSQNQETINGRTSKPSSPYNNNNNNSQTDSENNNHYNNAHVLSSSDNFEGANRFEPSVRGEGSGGSSRSSRPSRRGQNYPELRTESEDTAGTDAVGEGTSRDSIHASQDAGMENSGETTGSYQVPVQDEEEEEEEEEEDDDEDDDENEDYGSRYDEEEVKREKVKTFDEILEDQRSKVIEELQQDAFRVVTKIDPSF